MFNTWTYTLRRGHGNDPGNGACAMDAINWLVHGKHGDQPECACPVVGRYVIGLNDAMPDDQRQRLLPYLHRIAGSRSPAHEQVRAEILARGAVRVLAPLALDAAGLTAEAARLRALSADCTMQTTEEAAKAAAGTRETAAWAAANTAEAWAWAANTAEAWALAAAAWAANAAAWAAAARAANTAEAWAWAANTAEAWALAAAARAANAAAWAANAAKAAAAWDAALTLLDEALAAGPQGEPWSAGQVDAGMAAYRAAGGRVMA